MCVDRGLPERPASHGVSEGGDYVGLGLGSSARVEAQCGADVDADAIPAKVSEQTQADGDGGLANDVLEVNQYAAPT